MELKDLYIEAINHIHHKIKTSKDWWPNIVKRENHQTSYDLGKGEIGTSSIHSCDDHGHAHASATLKLLHFNERCTLFACPIEDCIENGYWKSNVQKEDVVVGFISGTKEDPKITPAWKNTVYPMIGNIDRKFDIPKDAKWILCAILDREYRKAVSLFCLSRNDFEQYTPSFFI